MALTDLLYRCPRCGQDPTRGAGDAADCAVCGTEYRREGRRIVVQAAQAAPEGVPGLPEAWEAGVEPPVLLAALERLGGALGAATREDGSVHHQARALHHGSLGERPVRRGGRLLGFVEEAGAGRPGLLEVTKAALRFRFDDGGEEAWPLDEVTALQLASRALQVGVRGGDTLQWTLQDDSPFRWEGLLQALLRRRWQEAGRGEIVEFQPRIVAG